MIIVPLLLVLCNSVSLASFVLRPRSLLGLSECNARVSSISPVVRRFAVAKEGRCKCDGIRRRGLPRSVFTADDLPLTQRLLLFIKRFTIEVTLVGIVLSLLRNVPLLKRCLGHPVNLARWTITSLAVRLIMLYSEINSSTPSIISGEDADWFLSGTYYAKPAEEAEPVVVRIRQVPGNGSCLFLSIAAGILCNESSVHGAHQHPIMSQVQDLSRKLRNQAVDRLEYNILHNKQLIIQNNETINASELVALAANQHGITSNEYLHKMRNVRVWGGGPEIVALANELERSIVLMGIDSADSGQISKDAAIYLKVVARFGPNLVGTNPAIYILSANQHFPNVDSNAAESHFLAVFPCSPL